MKLYESVDLYLKEGLEQAILVTLWKSLHDCLGLPGERVCQVSTIGVLKRLFCKGHSSLTQESLTTFIKVSPKTDHLLGDRAL